MSAEAAEESSGRLDPDRTTEALMRKARSAFSDAELLLENGSVESTINRGYYAAFQAARAALLTGGESPDTHSGVIHRFSYHFVRTEQVSVELGEGQSTLKRSFRERLSGRLKRVEYPDPLPARDS